MMDVVEGLAGLIAMLLLTHVFFTGTEPYPSLGVFALIASILWVVVMVIDQ